jgi:hypothetical protein
MPPSPPTSCRCFTRARRPPARLQQSPLGLWRPPSLRCWFPPLPLPPSPFISRGQPKQQRWRDDNSSPVSAVTPALQRTLSLPSATFFLRSMCHCSSGGCGWNDGDCLDGPACSSQPNDRPHSEDIPGGRAGMAEGGVKEIPPHAA